MRGLFYLITDELPEFAAALAPFIAVALAMVLAITICGPVV